MNAPRASALLQFLQDGKYVDGNTQSLVLRLFSYNSELRAFGYAIVKMAWERDGTISVVSTFNDLPVVRSPAHDSR